MATRSRSSTPPVTPLSTEEEVRTTHTPPPYDDQECLRESTSLLPVVDLSDDLAGPTNNENPSGYGRILSSLSHITPSIQTALGRRYPSSYQPIQRQLQSRIQPPRRNPTRLARPSISLGNPQRRRRSTSPSQEVVRDQFRSLSPVREGEEQQQEIRSAVVEKDSQGKVAQHEELQQNSHEKSSKEKLVSFLPTDHSSIVLEQPPSPPLQPSRRVELPPALTKPSRRRRASPQHSTSRIQTKESKNEGEGIRITKDFMNQLCQAFKVQDLSQLQKLLPYHPVAPQPLLSRDKQQTYYEYDLTYNAAMSEDSTSEISDDN